MGNFIHKGNDGFTSVLNTGYVDKSMLIAEVNSVMMTENRFLCVTRARRFGKSVAIKMLNAYYDKSCDSYELFNNLKIFKHKTFKQHLNRYPVLYLDMTDFLTKYGQDDQLVERIKNDICDELLSLYKDVRMKDTDDLMDLLVNIVNVTGEKFVCLIDEWDALCREGEEEQMDEYVDLLRRLFKGSKTDYVFACVYMTGILPIKRYNTQSALNNFEEYSMLNPAQLAPYFGFSDIEVAKLCKKANIDVSDMKYWYDGYVIGKEKSMYNPYAVMRALKRKSFENYWTSTNTFDSLRKYITMNFNGLKDDIISALNSVPVKVNALRFSNNMHNIECKDDVLTLLCHLGYLSYSAETQFACIPNFEVRKEFEMAIADSKWTEVINALQQSEYLLDCIMNGDTDEIAACIELVHMQNTSLLKYNDENSLACVLSLAFYTARNRFEMIRELPAGKGFADIVLIPYRHVDAPAIVLELKWNKHSDTAIKQIKRQEYGQQLLHYSGEIILAGITYDRKSKHHSCTIERISKSISGTKSGTKSMASQALSQALSQSLTWEQVKPLFELLQNPVLAKDMRGVYGFSDASKFRKRYIEPFLKHGLFAMTRPDVPNSRLQKYYLTDIGVEALKQMNENGKNKNII